MKLVANKYKQISIKTPFGEFERFPIKTSLISKKDNLQNIINVFIKPHLKIGDVLVISERIVAIIQGRSYLLSEIHPTPLAQFLSKFVSSHPGGIGLKSPWTMQLAIEEAGVPRILLAAFISFLTRPFMKGLFYHLVGNDINAIDGPCDYTLPPGNESAKLGPKNPQKVADDMKNIFDIGVVIIDANDYGVRIMGNSSNYSTRIIEAIFKDNPLGQTDEQTPLAIIRAR